MLVDSTQFKERLKCGRCCLCPSMPQAVIFSSNKLLYITSLVDWLTICAEATLSSRVAPLW
ncbi:hypothetical protein ZEAMMB73_Zm00001d002032 [Zea mays]|uniref:Uncharacterized protein n=1 Tax=Zea mays TaxID=4577 RepID=A0A1D6DVW6_MAIZE|nr:hypothetical protein ZEAMMB73_Zm00001d002032 [Zea mays]